MLKREIRKMRKKRSKTKKSGNENIIEFIGLAPGDKYVLTDDRAIYETNYQNGNIFFVVGNKVAQDEIEN